VATEALAWGVRRAAPDRLQRELSANVKLLGVLWDRRMLSIVEATLQLKVTPRIHFIEH